MPGVASRFHYTISKVNQGYTDKQVRAIRRMMNNLREAIDKVIKQDMGDFGNDLRAALDDAKDPFFVEIEQVSNGGPGFLLYTLALLDNESDRYVADFQIRVSAW
ncbi:hypothetical protein SCHPADRAFT_894851 [Schizopora paradoxa]|uniref:Uncharacterized protein n=1 Tax=Schizopora paradoxa TaxID=27342 RepID=A0A0H2R5R8_9AGAM|nr:hypothetical protein SCHPADRAFT_894851 [Schizopora paradoxa]